MSHLAFPYRVDERGRSARTDVAGHVRDLIELVLFTTPGERVNRPDFGTTLRQLLFAPNRGEGAATTKFLVQGALQSWLGHLIDVLAVDVEVGDARVEVTVRYVLRQVQAEQLVRFVRAV